MKALNAAGMKAVSLASVGQGFPDVAVGFRGVTCLLEIKDGEKPPSARELTAAEKEWHATWPGHAAVVDSPEAAITAVVDHARKMGRI